MKAELKDADKQQELVKKALQEAGIQ